VAGAAIGGTMQKLWMNSVKRLRSTERIGRCAKKGSVLRIVFLFRRVFAETRTKE